MDQQKKTFAQQAFTTAFLVGLPFVMNACNPLKGEGIRLWGGDEDKKAASANPQNQSGNRPAAPSRPTSRCNPNLSNSTLDPADPKLVKLIETAIKEEKDIRTGSDIHARLTKISNKKRLGFKPEEIDKLARSFIDLSRKQQAPATPAPGPSSLPLPSSDVETLVSDPSTTLESASTPPARLSKLHASVVALVAYDFMLDLIKRDKAGMDTKDEDMPRRSQEYTVRMMETSPPELAYVAIESAFEHAYKVYTDSKNPDRARAILEKIMSANKGKEAAALVTWVNAFKEEKVLALSEKEAMRAADKAVCYEPDSLADASHPSHPKLPASSSRAEQPHR